MKDIVAYLRDLLVALGVTIVHQVKALFVPKARLAAEIVLLRQQLSLFTNEVRAGKRKKPKTERVFRMAWVINAPICKDQISLNALYTRRTLARWHKTFFKFYTRH